MDTKRPTQFYFYYFLFAVCLIGTGFNLSAGNTKIVMVWGVTAVLLFLFFRRSRSIDKNILKDTIKKAAEAEKAVSSLDLLIREAGTDDFDLIRDIAHRTWPHTFEGILSTAQISYMLDLMYTRDSLGNQLQSGHIFLLLYSGEEALGFTSFQPDFPSLGETKLHKIYLLPQNHGKGCGKFLIAEVLSRIKSLDQHSIRLNVHRNNKAVHFYEKLGFAIFGQADIDIGEGFLANDYLMKKELDQVHI